MNTFSPDINSKSHRHPEESLNSSFPSTFIGLSLCLSFVLPPHKTWASSREMRAEGGVGERRLDLLASCFPLFRRSVSAALLFILSPLVFSLSSLSSLLLSLSLSLFSCYVYPSFFFLRLSLPCLEPFADLVEVLPTSLCNIYGSFSCCFYVYRDSYTLEEYKRYSLTFLLHFPSFPNSMIIRNTHMHTTPKKTINNFFFTNLGLWIDHIPQKVTQNTLNL